MEKNPPKYKVSGEGEVGTKCEQSNPDRILLSDVPNVGLFPLLEVTALMLTDRVTSHCGG